MISLPQPALAFDMLDAYLGWIEFEVCLDGGVIMVRFDRYGGEVERTRLEPYVIPIWSH